MSGDDIRAAIEGKLIDTLEEFGYDRSELVPEAGLRELDVSSLDMVELGIVVQESFGVELAGQRLRECVTLADVVDLVAEDAAVTSGHGG